MLSMQCKHQRLQSVRKKTAVQIVKSVTSATNCFATLHYLHAVVENVQTAYEYANCHQQGHAGSRTLSIEIRWLIKGVPANAGCSITVMMAHNGGSGSVESSLQCFDAVGWAAVRASGL